MRNWSGMDTLTPKFTNISHSERLDWWGGAQKN